MRLYWYFYLKKKRNPRIKNRKMKNKGNKHFWLLDYQSNINKDI